MGGGDDGDDDPEGETAEEEEEETGARFVVLDRFVVVVVGFDDAVVRPVDGRLSFDDGEEDAAAEDDVVGREDEGETVDLIFPSAFADGDLVVVDDVVDVVEEVVFTAFEVEADEGGAVGAEGGCLLLPHFPQKFPVTFWNS